MELLIAIAIAWIVGAIAIAVVIGALLAKKGVSSVDDFSPEATDAMLTTILLIAFWPVLTAFCVGLQIGGFGKKKGGSSCQSGNTE